MARKRRVQKPHPKAVGNQKWTKAYYVLGIFVAVITVVGLFAFAADRPTPTTSTSVVNPGVFVASMGNSQTDDINAAGIAYNSDPPTSGPHFVGGPAPWGIRTGPVPKGQMVSNLEIGGVIVSYNPQLPKEVVDKLARIIGGYSDGVLMAPYPGLDTPIALTAWTRILKLDSLDEPSIAAFISAYKGIDHRAKSAP